jgi:hypothetical protein
MPEFIDPKTSQKRSISMTENWVYKFGTGFFTIYIISRRFQLQKYFCVFPLAVYSVFLVAVAQQRIPSERYV